jgi:hypothetical protein
VIAPRPAPSACPVQGGRSYFHPDSAFEDGIKCLTKRLLSSLKYFLAQRLPKIDLRRLHLPPSENGRAGSNEIQTNPRHCPKQSRAFTEIWGNPLGLRHACLGTLEGKGSPLRWSDCGNCLVLAAGGALSPAIPLDPGAPTWSPRVPPCCSPPRLLPPPSFGLLPPLSAHSVSSQ